MDSSIGELIQQQSDGQNEEPLLGPVLVRLQGRLQTIEIKVLSLTKIVRLLQQYSEKKDQQYEKQSQNLAVIDSKIARIDSLQKQINQSLIHYEQLSVQYRTQNIKIENMNKPLESINSKLQTLQDKIYFDLSEVNNKVKQIETNMLQTIREGAHPSQSSERPFHSDHYAIEELTFRLSHLEATLQSQNNQIKAKLETLEKSNGKNKNGGEENHYGLIGERSRKSKSKRKVQNKSLEKGLKRLKSR